MRRIVSLYDGGPTFTGLDSDYCPKSKAIWFWVHTPKRAGLIGRYSIETGEFFAGPDFDRFKVKLVDLRSK